MEMFSEKEILLMIGVVGVLLLIIVFLTIFDIIDYIKAKKKIVNMDDDISLEETTEKDINNTTQKPKDDALIIEINDTSEEVKDDKDSIIEPFIEEDASIMLFPEKKKEDKEEQVKYVEVQKSNIDISVDNELNKVLNTIPDEENAILKFEEEQERTAIISLDELMKKSNELYNNNEIVQYDDGNEPITINEVIERFKNEEVSLPEAMQDIVEEKPIYTHKETIPFISSVYGIEKKSNELEFENTATYEKLSRSTNSDFMAKLKEVSENKN